MKFNFSLNEEDIDTFAKNLYKHSKHDKKQKLRVISVAIPIPILISVRIDKISSGTPAVIELMSKG
ncbi:hypothetical protein [Virgibacillus oceani]|uniref:Uncharacterized protein n=1 Tax=Virgibacillus oceani TaxID=1479511 RepID=A0A917HF71_9BACI|nr:hypothetical protein [Virgibacillus oceani]GGG76042.1 hypothetical protein GCM10011398_21200 [Virgibacillus oceani]